MDDVEQRKDDFVRFENCYLHCVDFGSATVGVQQKLSAQSLKIWALVLGCSPRYAPFSPPQTLCYTLRNSVRLIFDLPRLVFRDR